MRRAAGNVIGAVGIFLLEKRDGYGIDVRSVCGNLSPAVLGVPPSIPPRTEVLPQRRHECGGIRAIAARENGKFKGNRGPLGRQTVLLREFLERAEEEKLVLLDRAAEHAAELVLVEHLPAVLLDAVEHLGIFIAEKLVGIEDGVAEKLKHVSVIIVGAGLGHHVGVGAHVPAVTGVEQRSLDLEFLNRVRVHQDRCWAPCRIGQKSAGRGIRNRHTVHGGAVLAEVGAVHGNVRGAFSKLVALNTDVFAPAERPRRFV